jgi:hypothetical protein
MKETEKAHLVSPGSFPILSSDRSGGHQQTKARYYEAPENFLV